MRIETFTTFGDLLKYLRVRAQLSQRDLAIAVGYSEAQISRLESNKRPPNVDALKALFVPALMLEDVPKLADRLLDLAGESRKSSFSETQIPFEAHAGKRHNLPAELTSLMGRETELAEIARLLGLPATRLLTLTGSGGCGKTRPALDALGEAAFASAWEQGAAIVKSQTVIEEINAVLR